MLFIFPLVYVNSDDEDVDEGVDIPALREPLPVQSTIEVQIG